MAVGRIGKIFELLTQLPRLSSLPIKAQYNHFLSGKDVELSPMLSCQQ
jgi:hypothetical protein